MSHLYLLVQEALKLGYLSIEAEGQLKRLCHQPAPTTALADEDTLLMLKQAIAFGHVKRQAIELRLRSV